MCFQILLENNGIQMYNFSTLTHSFENTLKSKHEGILSNKQSLKANIKQFCICSPNKMPHFTENCFSCGKRGTYFQIQESFSTTRQTQ